MQLLSLGLNFQTAPLELRERVSLSGSVLDDAISALKGRVHEGFVLSTCNRTELYALVGHAETGAELLRGILCELTGVSAEEITSHLYIKSREEVVKHLFLVASGVESMVPGEDQILAQIKVALERADSLKALGSIMHRLGDSALAVGKQVRTKTGIGRHSLSVVSVALQLAADRLGTLDGRNVVIVGAGQTAELAIKHISGSAKSITVINRTAERGAELAERYGVLTATRDQLSRQIANADLVLSCTSSPLHVIEAADVALAMSMRADLGSSAPLVMFDLAVPRDIAKEAGNIDNVTLWDIDHLQGICAENRLLRTAEIARVEELVDADVHRFISWLRARQVIPTIQALVTQSETIQEVEITRMMSRLSFESDRDKELVKTLVSRVVNKLLHRPITLLKEDPEGANMAHVVQHLFGLSQCPVVHGTGKRSMPSRESSVPASPTPAGLTSPISDTQQVQ